MKFWIISILLSLVIAFSVGLLIPQLLFDEMAATEIDYAAKKEKLVQEFSEELIVAIAHSTQTETPESDESLKGQETQNTKNQSDDDETETIVEQTLATTPVETQTKTQPVTQPVTQVEKKTPVVVSNEWIQAEIDKNIDQIDLTDLERGAAIFERLDTHYLFELADGGLTPEEKIKYEAYLDQQLTKEEKDLVKTLFDKYVGLLND